MKLDIPQILLSLLLVPVGIVYGHGVVVSEIMIGSDGVSPFYVEFYNLGEIDVDLSGAELSLWNNYDPGDKFEPYSATLPRGSILPGNGYYTIASESTIAGVPADLRIPLAGHTMKKESGTIILASAQSGIIARALWGARNGGEDLPFEDGASLCYHHGIQYATWFGNVRSPVNWCPSAKAINSATTIKGSPGRANEVACWRDPVIPTVVVNEIMIGNDGVSPFYLELYNLSQDDVDLSGAELRLWNNTLPDENLDPYLATLPRGSILRKNGYYTIASETTIAGVPADLHIPLAGHTMKTEGGYILLTETTLGIIARATWGARYGGEALPFEAGASLCYNNRIAKPTKYGNLLSAVNWCPAVKAISSMTTIKGSPGRDNEVACWQTANPTKSPTFLRTKNPTDARI
jgi:Lamin Tail Domain